MPIHRVPMNAAHLSRCEALWSDRPVYTGTELRHALRAAARLIDERRALGSVTMEDGRLRGFGLATFVHEASVWRQLERPVPDYGRRLLLGLDPVVGDRAILDRRAVAERNAGQGLELVVVNTNYDPDAADVNGVIGSLLESFRETFRGYRLARILGAFHGPVCDLAVRSGWFERIQPFTDVGGVRGLDGALATMTRAYAADWRHPFMGMFGYTPPRVRFTHAEQALLIAALGGAPDEALARTLGASVSATKARWARIRQRVADRAPEIFEGLRASRQEDRRGAQQRHLILEYVRRHPSELTPYAAAGPRARETGPGSVRVRRSA